MVKSISADELKKLLDSQAELILIDARAREDYVKNHLPGAISLLFSEVEEKASQVLKKGVPIVVYSNDADCPASGLVAAKLDELGYEPVYNYNPSYADWVKRGYPLSIED